MPMRKPVRHVIVAGLLAASLGAASTQVSASGLRAPGENLGKLLVAPVDADQVVPARGRQEAWIVE